MFVTRLSPRGLHGEKGSALIAVLGIAAVLAIVTVTVSTVTVQAMGSTSSARASVQSRAAADAGIDAALARLKTTNGCMVNGTVVTSPTVPTFTATITYSLNSGASWVGSACPPNNATHVRILSTGEAEHDGVAGASAGDQSTVEATYTWKPIITAVPIDGAAVYSHSHDSALKKFKLTTADRSVATSVMIKNGDVECTNGASIGGDLILGSGSARLDMCDVAGKIHVNGNLDINKSNIGGSIRATGTLSITDSTYDAAQTQSGAGVSPPVIPDWVDVGWNPSHWTGLGYTVVNWAASCSIAKNNTPWEDIEDYTTPTVINFLNACPNTPVTTANNMNTVVLNTNVVFVANQFSFDKLYFISGPVAPAPPAPAPPPVDRTLTFLVPDDVADGQPTCAPTPPSTLKGGIHLSNESNFGSHIAAMLYTPCKIHSDRDGFRGQMYSGEVEFDQQATLQFTPVGIDGIDLTDGLTHDVVTGSTLDSLVGTKDRP